MKLVFSLTAGLLSAGLAASQTVSTDGSCGGTTGLTCKGSSFGDCCSKYGWCGASGDAYCGAGCQSEFGACTGSSTTSSTTRTSSTVQTSPATPLPSGSNSAKECLNGKDVPYKMSSDAEYAELIEPYNLRIPYTPAVVVIPTTNQHVQDAVVCAGQSGLKVQAKSGGHSYANFGNGGKDGSLIINLQSLQTVELNQTSGVATVGGGVRLGNLADGIFTQGKAAVSHGTCPGVGIGGHYTHGGYSHTSRNFGLAMDQIVAADVVLADGKLIKASQTENTEIFWAIRGAAEYFGIVTQFYLQTRAAPDNITYFAFPLGSVWNDKTTFTNSFLHIQDVATNASIIDDRISFGIYLDGQGSFSLSGAFFGSVDEFNSTIKPELLRNLPTPTTDTVKSYSWYDYLVLVSGESTIKVPATYEEHENFFAKSLTVPEADGLSADSLNAFYDYIKSGTSVNFYVIINLYGGPGSAINTKDTDFAAYKDRDSLWVFQNWGYATGSGDAVSFINGLNSAIVSAQPQTDFGAYLNYVDPSLDADAAHKVYYGDALYARLAALKKTVDPENVFWNPQGITV